MEILDQMAAERGAQLLDEYEPGWYRRVNPALLDLRHCEHCILGQVFGSAPQFGKGSGFMKGVHTLGLENDWHFWQYYGFTGRTSKEAWLQVIGDRLWQDAEQHLDVDCMSAG